MPCSSQSAKSGSVTLRIDALTVLASMCQSAGGQQTILPVADSISQSHIDVLRTGQKHPCKFSI